MLNEQIRIGKKITSIYEVEDNEEETPIIRKHTFDTRICFGNDVHDIFHVNCLPKNCRYKTSFNQYDIYVIEEEPQIRTISVNLCFDDIIERFKATGKLEKYGYQNFSSGNLEEKLYKFYLSFPYIIYYIVIDRTYMSLATMSVYFRLSPLKHLSDYLLYANLLNINHNQKLCLGDNIPTDINNEVDACNKIIEKFWANSFNNDYIHNYKMYSERPGCEEISDFLTWQYYTKIDPLFIFKMNWKKIRPDNHIISNINNFKRRTNEENSFNYLKERLFEKNTIKDKDNNNYLVISYDSIFISGNFYDLDTSGFELSVGDSILFKNGKEAYVDKILKSPDIYENSSVILLDVNDKIVHYKLTKAFAKYISSQFHSNNSIDQIVLQNNDVISAGKICKIKTPSSNQYKKVHKIKKGIDNEIEISFVGNDLKYYILSNIEIELEKELINHIGESFYYMTYDHYDKIYYIHQDEYKVSDIQIINGELKIILNSFFENSTSIKRKRRLTIQNFKKDFIKTSELENFINGVLIRYNTIINCNYMYRNNEFYILKINNSNMQLPDLQSIFSNDNKTITINRMYGSPLNFNIGDKVVVADWQDPINMLKIKKITKFIINEETLSFELIDKNNNVELVSYIIKDKVLIEKIRKIDLIYDGIEAGTKIKATTKSIKNFPKKDTNIIIGFISDTGSETPLVLCSNCCTIWAEDLVPNFQLIKMNDPRWKKLKHAPIDISKIKIQAGDIVGYKLDNYKRFIKKNNLVNIENYNWTHYNANDFILYGILSPRYSTKQIMNMEWVCGFPTYQNTMVKNSGGLDKIYMKGI